MISVILPYWDRQAAIDKALLSIAAAYPLLSLEIVVVDDGNPVPFRKPVLPETLDVRVLELPKKDRALSPVVPWNEGVKHARGETIVLSCAEILHPQPVLLQMYHELRQTPNGYVMAAAWCPEFNEWHCHSERFSAGAPRLPKGWGRSFCAMLTKSLYWKAGGFDEDYRDGAGYEDIDWVYRLIKAGAKPVICNDLVVIHPKTDASIQWGAEQFVRNKTLLEKKWSA